MKHITNSLIFLIYFDVKNLENTIFLQKIAGVNFQRIEN